MNISLVINDSVISCTEIISIESVLSISSFKIVRHNHIAFYTQFTALPYRGLCAIVLKYLNRHFFRHRFANRHQVFNVMKFLETISARFC